MNKWRQADNDLPARGDTPMTASPAMPGDGQLRPSSFKNLFKILLLCGLAGAAQAQTVQAWITTGDQTQLLARGADSHFHSGAKAATIIEVDPKQRFQQMVGFGAA